MQPAAPLKFRIPTGINPAKGKMLLAQPFMPDHNFTRSVIFLCNHDDGEGSFGLVLNRELSIRLADALPDLAEFDAPLFFGGPVQPDTLNYLHRVPQLLDGSEEILEGVFIGGDFEQLKSGIATKQITAQDIRFFVGYSGWNAGQIEEEMKEDSWIIAHGHKRFVFEKNPDQLWKKIMESLGGDYRIMANFPEDITSN